MAAAATLRLGTRGSALALAQAGTVADALGGAELVQIRTSGDERSGEASPSHPVPPGRDKSRFVREIERALLDGEVELAVHSAKDLPTELPDGLGIAGVPAREDPRDAFVGEAASVEALPDGARVGTSSLRRRAQLLALRPDLEVVEMRGNVDTRLRKLAEGDLDGIVLAAAGLARLGRAGEISFAFDREQMTPAAGQGALAIEARDGDAAAAAAGELTDAAARAELACERALVSALGASCDTPVGASAEAGEGRLVASGFAGLPDGSEWIRDRVDAAIDLAEPNPDAAEALGRAVAERMLGAGAAELLERAEAMAAELAGAGG
jgi:hydroxymethylbilane synthase